MASAHVNRPATMAPAALARMTVSAGSSPERSPSTSAPPKASPAPSPHTTFTGTGATEHRPSAVATSTPSAPIFTTASDTPLSSSRSAAVSGSEVPTAISHSARLPTATVAWPTAAPMCSRASDGDAQKLWR